MDRTGQDSSLNWEEKRDKYGGGYDNSQRREIKSRAICCTVTEKEEEQDEGEEGKKEVFHCIHPHTHGYQIRHNMQVHVMHRPCVMSAERLLQHASRRALVLHQVHTIGLEGEGVGGASIRNFLLYAPQPERRDQCVTYMFM